MNIADIFNKNFFSFAEMLCGAPGGGRLALSGDSFAASSGQPHAGENYALLARGAEYADVTHAAGFFAERGAGFVIPWLPQTPQAVARALEERGIERRRIYTSMYLPADAERAPAQADVVRVTKESAPRWAEAAWRAFGGEAGKAEAAYIPFGKYLAGHAKNTAFALEEDGRFISTALIHDAPKAYGLYYFATMPDSRMRGRAARLMDGVTASLTEKKPLVLLATEAGLSFYIKYGFKIIDKVPIYCADDDI